MKRFKFIFFVGCFCLLIACSSPSSVLPTLTPTAAVPPTKTPIPAPTPTFAMHTNLDSLVELVIGTRLRNLAIDTYESDGLSGHDIDITVYQPHELSRLEMLEMVYNLTHEYYYNYANSDLTFITLHLRAGTEDDPPDLLNCSFGLGIGYESIAQYLPENRPENLESWYRRLVAARYYGDLPGQTDAQLAYANDPKSQTFCGVEEWKK